MRTQIQILTLSLLLSGTALPLSSQQTQPEAPADGAEVGEPATPAEAQAFLGYWVLHLKLGERQTEFGLVIDAEGSGVEGRLVSPFGQMEAKDFRRRGDLLAFDLTSNFGNFAVETRIEEGSLLGEFSDEGGSIQSSFRGERSDRAAFQRFVVPPNEARLERGDQLVRLRFATPPAGERDFGQIESLQPGEIVQFLEHPAIKLTTELDLVFGDLQVPTGNVAPDYPGVYALWLKRTEGGWSLVFNRDADVWGTQHDPSRDLGEVPLESSRAAEPSARMKGELIDGEDGAVLRLTWGPHVWSAPFRVVTGSPQG